MDMNHRLLCVEIHDELLQAADVMSCPQRSDITVQDTVILDDKEQLSVTEIALDAVYDFYHAVQLSIIETAVHFYHEALLLPN